ncbi:hypothetical protein FDP41_000785 [Naegleria fowleri]|uniref:F-box domain-containing protein n=1 Tax=Naegleria fowleri TaxID=5763 RepID=A0A6A5CB17_NAEFO|nr:uncharacterized protein FDP41_000785 [Naegleria fowleri]KAF0984886.1 hypothetical protein FDP41_000785 [Naegleria fowleri]CAG4719268.1 unnamed protein product [Naegleria fowleri]
MIENNTSNNPSSSRMLFSSRDNNNHQTTLRDSTQSFTSPSLLSPETQHHHGYDLENSSSSPFYYNVSSSSDHHHQQEQMAEPGSFLLNSSASADHHHRHHHAPNLALLDHDELLHAPELDGSFSTLLHSPPQIAANMTSFHGKPFHSGYTGHASAHHHHHHPSQHHHSNESLFQCLNQDNYIVGRPMVRIHVFPNGTLQYGKMISFDPVHTSFEELIAMVSAKFRYSLILSSNKDGISNASSTDQVGAGSARSEKESDGLLPKLFSLRGTEIDSTDQIINNDVFCFVPPTEPFRPPISLERVLLSNLDSSQPKAYHVYSQNNTALSSWMGNGNNNNGTNTSNVHSRVPHTQNHRERSVSSSQPLYPEEVTVGPPPVASSSSSTMSHNNNQQYLASNSMHNSLNDNIPVGTNNATTTTTTTSVLDIAPFSTPTKKVISSKLITHSPSSPVLRANPSPLLPVHRGFPVNMVDPMNFATPFHFASPTHFTSNTVSTPRVKKQIIRLIPDLYYQIFSFLTHKELALGIGLVCKEFEREFARNEMLWKELCMNVYSYYLKRKYQNMTNSKSSERYPRFFSGTPLHEIKSKFMNACEKPPCYYRSWKTYYRFFINWALKLCWDTCERGNNIKFKNNNATVYREDNITYHWQTVRTNLPIRIPTEMEKRKNGYMTLPLISASDLENGEVDIITDDVAIYEFEVKIEKFDKSNANGWWIVVGLETEAFPYKESTPTNLIGYDRHAGFGYAGGNGDNLHFYSNTHLKHKQPFTCDPVVQWNNVPFNEGDIVKGRIKYYLKAFEDAIDPKNNIGSTLSWYINGKFVGECFRNITGTLFPAVSLLTNQSVTLRCVDPMFELIARDFK